MGFILNASTPILINRPTKPLENAAAMLRRDLAAVSEPGTIYGSISVKLPMHELTYDESYKIIVDDDGIVISVNSSLGGVFGLLEISRRFLNIMPFWFWAEHLPARRKHILVDSGVYVSPAHAVRFRGWFLNDEVLLNEWKPKPDDTDYVWKMVFEALLRCGGNMVIPGTDQNSRKNRQLAGEMGLWITHHHAEPLGAEMFARAYPGQIADYTLNESLFKELWTESIRQQDGCNVIWNLGFRGQGDRPFWADDPSCDTPEKRGARISEVIDRQYSLVHELCKNENSVCCTNIYGEVSELYRQGHITLPSDVILIWADSGYGKLVSRRQGNHNPRVPIMPKQNSPHGIYFHASFYDLQASRVGKLNQEYSNAVGYCRSLQSNNRRRRMKTRRSAHHKP